MGTRLRALESTAVALLLAACSGSLKGAPTAAEAGPGEMSTDASTDVPAASSTDASDDSPDEANASADAGPDAQADAPASCGSPLGQVCADGGGCMLSWATAAQPANWCHRALWFDIGAGCGGYDFVVVHGRDTATIYYYDAVSGSLVGVVFVPSSGCAGVNPGVNEGDCADGGTWHTFSCSIDGSVGD